MDRDTAYRLALLVEARARLDARSWVARLPRQVSLLAGGRAEQVLEPNRDDPLRAGLAREWCVRVFTDHARNELGLGRPEIEVTPTETEHLAECLRTGVAYRIHGPGRSVVANLDSPTAVPGQAGYAERQQDVDDNHGLTERQTRQVLEALAGEQDRRRAEDQQIVGAAWDQLTPDQRTAFAQYWHTSTTPTATAPSPQPHPPKTSAPPCRPRQRRARSRPWPTAVTATPVPGRPKDAAAGVSGTEAADLAAARAAYDPAAQAFPQNRAKPPTITTSGAVRDSGRAGQAAERRLVPAQTRLDQER